jgi:membrane-associated phospholipid phosphatase
MIVSMHFAGFITDFADQSIIIPTVVIIGVVFSLLRWWRGMIAWTAVWFGTLSLVLLLKVMGLICKQANDGLRFSLSGHTACAALLYGSLSVALLSGRIPPKALYLIPAAISILIGYTRIVVHAHSVSEVFLGGTVGCISAEIFRTVAATPKRFAVNYAFIMLVFVTTLFHGAHLPVETSIRKAVLHLHWTSSN